MSENKNLTANDYQSAIDVQNACNLSGVVHSFSRVMAKICHEANEGKHFGTEWKNSHAICRMYAEQIMHLTSNKDWNKAHDECEEKAKR